MAFRLTVRRAASSILVDGKGVALEPFIMAGPLFNRVPSHAAVAGAPTLDVARWESHGAILVEEILRRRVGEPLTLAEAVRVYQYYLPVFFWIEGLVAARPAGSGPLFVGLSCPQGGGKTTLVDALHLLFGRDGKVCADMSLDDFYLTHREQQALATANPGNGLLELRGNPGTHDTGLAQRTLAALASVGSSDGGSCGGRRGGGGGDGSTALVPRYDKTAFKGRGDRLPEAEWTLVAARPDVVLFEGWCFGFAAKGTEQLEADEDDPRLAPVDAVLGGPYRELHRAMEAWVVVEVASVGRVYAWREEAEANSRRAGKPAMTEAETKDFVDR